MANVNAPYGFVPWGITLSQHGYTVNASTAVYRNDVVDLSSAGLLQAASAGSLVLLGSSAGYYAASATKALVYDDPKQVYHAQDLGSNTTPAQTTIGNYTDHTATAADTSLNRSKHSLTFTLGSTGTIWANAGGVTSVPGQGGFLVLDLLQAPDNAFGQYAKMVVGIQEHIRNTGAGI